MTRTILPVAGFFAIKLAVGAVLTVFAATWMPPDRFASFTQLFLFTAWANMICTGGVINGVIRRVAHHGDDDTSRETIGAALAIWAGVGMLVCTAVLTFRAPLSVFLVGSREATAYLVPIAMLSVAGGGGQLLTGVLTGRGRQGLSLSLQALGTALGGIACAIVLYRGEPYLAAVVFAAGPVVTTAISWAIVRPGIILSVRAEAARLLRHSGAFVAVATIPPLTLFALRSVYTEQFGLGVLAFWLLANRVSDINIQFSSLYLTQYMLPKFTRTDAAGVRRLAMRTAVIAFMITALPAAAFLLTGRFFLATVFGPAYAPAWGMILTYLAGDAPRAVVLVAMNVALSRERFVTYVLLELSAAAVLASVFLALVKTQGMQAPAIAYLAANVAVAAAVGLYGVSRLSSGKT